ncbi:BET1 homolog [Exaiptasia diaphana]|uniref:BET1 homolog n=1 Tax=Exaiptasia diaphana TaxID=2652724 RepID=A0A913XGN4_EXADI|nr:BET1 homolog [Exaiptasia diaphana]XP_020911846.1 BET1 homolog [Exaiptasia diaphana]KXJ07956.1 BET1-like [Exaiptasia diaphana]KXJ12338.1 BET1-like [Exaiptasia diaphana]
MRRAHNIGNGMNSLHRSDQMLEDENERLENDLSNKVQTLKSLSIDIGHEVRSQNQLLNDMDDDFDTSGGLLSATMGRLTALTKKGHHKIMCYLMLFCLFVFFVAWFIVRRR